MNVIADIISVVYKKYGPNTIFQELDYSVLYRKDCIVFYRVRTLFCTKDYFQGEKIAYDIQYHKFNVSLVGLLNMTKKCMHCNKKYCNYKFNCCKKFIHSECFPKISDCCFNLIKIKRFEECVVCYEDCLTKTKCGHIICESCVKQIKKDDGSIECPMCRRCIKDKRHYLDIITLEISDDKKIKVRITEVINQL